MTGTAMLLAKPSILVNGGSWNDDPLADLNSFYNRIVTDGPLVVVTGVAPIFAELWGMTALSWADRRSRAFRILGQSLTARAGTT